MKSWKLAYGLEKFRKEIVKKTFWRTLVKAFSMMHNKYAERGTYCYDIPTICPNKGYIVN